MAVSRPHYYLYNLLAVAHSDVRTVIVPLPFFFLSTDGPQLEKSWPSCILLPHTIKKSKRSLQQIGWAYSQSQPLFRHIPPTLVIFKNGGGGEEGLFRGAFSHDFMHNKADQWANTASSLIDRRNSKVLECVCYIDQVKVKVSLVPTRVA
jgi:hypothetical protein